MGGPGSGRRPNGATKNMNANKKKKMLTLYKPPKFKPAGRKNGVWVYSDKSKSN